MDRILLVISTLCFLFGFAHTVRSLRSRGYRHSRLNFFSILSGFLFQTAFLYVRGEQIGRCPLTTTFEFLIFLSWSVVLFYLLIGPAYRLSLLGAFTSPVVFLFQVVALLALSAAPGAPRPPASGWLELHAALSVVAYGAFALAGVAGVMYLTQDRQLKTHHIHSIFFHLPPIRDLATANRRLILVGFGLFSVALTAGWAHGTAHLTALRILSVAIWLLYGGVLAAVLWHRISPRRVAWFSVGAFAAVLSTMWGLSFISERGGAL
jgi:ABC-type uncharacterized transport system permease subunit